MDEFELIIGRAALSHGEAYRIVAEGRARGDSPEEIDERLIPYGLNSATVERESTGRTGRR